MSTENNSSCCASSPFIPLLLLSVSLLIFLFWQVGTLSGQRTNLQNLINNQQAAVEQSHQVQANLEKIVNDLLLLAQDGDADAKAITTKFGISRQGGPAATPAAAK